MGYVTVDVDVDLEMFDDEELISELGVRGYRLFVEGDKSVIVSLFEKMRDKKITEEERNKLLSDFFYDTIGRIY